MQHIPVAIIGCGMSARTFHLPLIAASADFRLTALVSSRPQPDVAVAQFPDTAAMLAQSDAELVVITAPNAVHFSLAAQCLAAGRHVVLEKPMVNTVAEGRELMARAEHAGRLLSVFHNRRWDSDFLTLQSLLARGELGTLRFFESRWDRFRPEVRDRWRENPGVGAGIWYDLGAHLLDQALTLFGMPQAVTGNCRALRAGRAFPRRGRCGQFRQIRAGCAGGAVEGVAVAVRCRLRAGGCGAVRHALCAGWQRPHRAAGARRFCRFLPQYRRRPARAGAAGGDGRGRAAGDLFDGTGAAKQRLRAQAGGGYGGGLRISRKPP